MYLWWFRWLLGFEGFVLKGCFLGECASCPGSSCCRSSDGLLLLLLLLLLVVRGCCRVHRCLITWIWSAWKQIQESNNKRCCNENRLNVAFYSLKMTLINQSKTFSLTESTQNWWTEVETFSDAENFHFTKSVSNVWSPTWAFYLNM